MIAHTPKHTKVKTLEALDANKKAENVNVILKDSLTFNERLAIKITNGVGNMWCAYIFGVIALISLPAAISGGVATIISWIAQTFLQLVLLSIIMVGQNVQSKRSELRAEEDFEINKKAEVEIRTILQHLENQSEISLKILNNLDVKK